MGEGGITEGRRERQRGEEREIIAPRCSVCVGLGSQEVEVLLLVMAGLGVGSCWE